MVEKIYENIYKIEVQLPNNPLKALNAYIIKGEERSLLIDTGFNCETCKADLLQGLELLEINLNKLDLLITHLHSDHCGLMGLFKATSTHIYASKTDADYMNAMSTKAFETKIKKEIRCFDLEKDGLKYDQHPGHRYAPTEAINFTLVHDKEIINIGDYKLEVVDTSGHTPGMVGLYERTHKLYFSADHVLDQISPNISFWSFEFDSLRTYIDNLTKMIAYDIDHTFPAHRNIMEDHPRRIKELIAHHIERIEEVYLLVKKDPQSVRDIAAKMRWRVRARSWEDFPTVQKMFAAGEAMAHLEYLYNDGRLIREERDGILYYGLI